MTEAGDACLPVGREDRRPKLLPSGAKTKFARCKKSVTIGLYEVCDFVFAIFGKTIRYTSLVTSYRLFSALPI
jgi:hypothetical protein